MPTDDAFRDLRESPELGAFLEEYLPVLRGEAVRLREIGAKRIHGSDLDGDQHKYEVFVRLNRHMGEINDDIIPEAIRFFEAIKGRSFDDLGVMNGNGLMYLGLAPNSFLGIHRDYPDGTHRYNRVVLPLDIPEPAECTFAIERDGEEIVRSFAHHPHGYSFNPAARHAAMNDSRRSRTVMTFQFERT